MPNYKVNFEVFEGPLDLLLYLIKKEEVDIYQVNLTRLATQFIEHIETMRLLDLEIAGEFLVMAATLMYIKSRELLPVEQQAQTDPEEDGEDPRWELIRQLVEYKKFKDAAAKLGELESRQENVFPRLPIQPEFEQAQPGRSEASIFDLVNAVNVVLKRFTERLGDQREIYEDKFSVSEKIEVIRGMVEQRGRFTFSELFESAASRAEVVATFLALLELIRLKILTANQPETFGQIELCKAEPSEPATAGTEGGVEITPSAAGSGLG